MERCSAEELNNKELIKDTAVVEEEEELVFPTKVHMLYNACEKGGYSGEFELPDDETFDPKELVVHVRSIYEGAFSIVTGASYKGEFIEMSGDTDGKGTDWFIVYRDQLESFL